MVSFSVFLSNMILNYYEYKFELYYYSSLQSQQSIYTRWSKRGMKQAKRANPREPCTVQKHLVEYSVTIYRTVTYAVELFCWPVKPLIQFFSHTYINKGFCFGDPHLLKPQVLQEIAIHSLASVFLLWCQSACKIRWKLNIVKTWLQFLGLTAGIS